MALISKDNFIKNVSLAWPLALNSMLVQSMVVIDLMMIAPLGEVSVNALGIATAIVGFLIGTQFALSNGTQILIARRVGSGDAGHISNTLATGWMINIGFSILTFLMLLIGSGYFLELVVDHQDVMLAAQRYINISAWMILFSSVTQVIIVYFNGSARTRIPLYGFMLEIPFNIVFSFLFINGLFGAPTLGVQGAALGSLIAVMIRLLYLFSQLRRDRDIHIVAGIRSIDWQQTKLHLHETLPIAANFITLTGGMLVYQMLFAQLDIYAYAAIALVMPWMRMGSQFANSWSQATAIHISQFRGRDELQQIPEFVRQMVWITFIVASLISLFFLLFSLVLPNVYPAMEEQTLMALKIIAPVYILTPLVRTYNTLCGHSLRALGESINVLRLHVLSQWAISLPLLALLIFVKAPLLAVFGVTLLEECLKTMSFRRKLSRKMVELSA